MVLRNVFMAVGEALAACAHVSAHSCVAASCWLGAAGLTALLCQAIWHVCVMQHHLLAHYMHRVTPLEEWVKTCLHTHVACVLNGMLAPQHTQRARHHAAWPTSAAWQWVVESARNHKWQAKLQQRCLACTAELC